MPESSPPNRAAAAAKIAANPSGYKVCEGCDSIVGSATAICPNCHSYRFDISPERVTTQAKILGAREQTSVTASDLG
jgi:RNA polymerase subunit RPABC4/transcription elongation factor Spt4